MILGATTWLWVSPLTTVAAEKLIPRIAQLGFGAVELPLEDLAQVDARRVRRALEDHGLRPSVCGVFGPGRDLTNASAAVRSGTLDYIKGCLDFAVEVSAPLVCGPLYAEVGKRRQLPDAERKAEWNLAVEGVHAACEAAAARGRKIAIEPLNRFETDLVNTVADAVRLARDTAHPAAGVMIDSFHMTIEEDDLERAVRDAGEFLLHVQVSENQRGIPGTGLTNWPALRRGLNAVGYKGMVVIESFTPENRDLAGAVCIWKRRAVDQDTFARQGLTFLTENLANPISS
jgi:D-psicose/D-tagatose/L-ribulose 3-epimerase